MKITKGKIPCAKKVVIYGPEGIGKSTFASQFPDPVFIDTEGSTNNMDISRLPAPTNWSMLLEEVRYIMQNPSVCRTLVIDTADWAEQLCSAAICGKYQKSGIEDFGYGKGYVFLQEEFGKLLNLLTELVEQKKINAVLTAHAKMRKFEQPDEMGAYDRWEMKLSKNVSPMVKEWADMVLFANYKTHVIKVNGKNKAQGGKRVIYTTHHSCWDAKNRYGLDDELPFDYSSVSNVIEETAPEGTRPVQETVQPVSVSDKITTEKLMHQETPAPKEPALSVSGEQINMNLPETEASDIQVDPRVPKALRDLMLENQISDWDLENVVESRGYVPVGTPIWEYDTVNPGIVEGLLVPCWDQVMNMIREMREKEEIPFD